MLLSKLAVFRLQVHCRLNTALITNFINIVTINIILIIIRW